jgi:hypothetical protein
MAFTEKQTAIIVISVLFPLTATLLVGLRLRARVLTSERIKADDYWIVTAVVSFLAAVRLLKKSHYWQVQVLTAASVIPYIISVSAACAGIHSRYCTPTQQIRFAKIVFAIQLLYLASVSSVKISLLLFYKRVFPGKRFGYIVTVTLGLSGIWFLAFFFAQLFETWPISASWTLNPNGSYAWAINEQSMNLWLCGTDILVDVFLLLLPVPVITSLRMSRKDKLAFLGIFSLGLL